MRPGRSRVTLSRGGRYRRELNPLGKEVVQGVLTETAAVHGLAVDGLSFRRDGLYAIVNAHWCTQPQGMHTDYSSTMVQHLRGTPHFPRSAIWAVHAPFQLVTRDHGKVTVPIQHVIFFRADFWHCGGPALSTWARFHGFQLPEALAVPGAVYT